MNTLNQIFGSLGDAALFRSITNYIDARIAYFTESTLSNVMTIVGTVALVLLTLWIIWYGYQMVMGSSQHSAKDFVFKAVRAWIIIAFATGVAATMGFSIRTMTTTMSDAISQTLTNSDDASACTHCGNRTNEVPSPESRPESFRCEPGGVCHNNTFRRGRLPT